MGSALSRSFPKQGAWSEEEYLALDSNKLIEFSDGCIEILPMPTTSHQLIVLSLYEALSAFVLPKKLGVALVAPLRMRLRPRKYREPDIMFMLSQNAARVREEFWEGADLVMEVVSPDGRTRDWKTKRQDYAQARIPEYWIVDPQQERILVLRLKGDSLIVHGDFGRGTKATSIVLKGFAVDVAAVLAAGRLK